ncbi:glycosyltransferase family 4 protein [Maridesulfovibrio bastinii]|uniref:glycosyltransferase family 4 protein n=1 Tax=Maridesulfovibrio bastinii TaxID=47157 RepID=UPI000413BADB|nr:glycosyltransferase family 4 protein [Maridesulfovibrio bastinii]
MRIAFYAPHKTIDHPTPSGDLFIGKSLFDSLKSQRHDIRIISRFRARNISKKPLRFITFLKEYRDTLKLLLDFNPDLWLTYHSYYKSPDILGPLLSQKLNVPYVIYQGVFSTKRRREFINWPGYILNKKALLNADHIFANKSIDYKNLSRIILPEKLSFQRPGIQISQFQFSAAARKEIRNKLEVDAKTVILSVAMFRKGVKQRSLLTLLEAYKKVETNFSNKTQLILAGDGECREELVNAAQKLGISSINFIGAISRNELYKYYSAADIFAYPGIGEALGMVYLEAQATGLPAVAFNTRGPSEAIESGSTGILTEEGNIELFASAICDLVKNKKLRKAMSLNSRQRIAELFDINTNFKEIEQKLLTVCKRRQKWEQPV